MEQKRKRAMRTLRFWVRAVLLVLGLFVVAVVVAAVVIAQDPARAANDVNGVLDALDDGVRAVLYAPIHFFQALLTFVERLFK